MCIMPDTHMAGMIQLLREKQSPTLTTQRCQTIDFQHTHCLTLHAHALPCFLTYTAAVENKGTWACCGDTQEPIRGNGLATALQHYYNSCLTFYFLDVFETEPADTVYLKQACTHHRSMQRTTPC